MTGIALAIGAVLLLLVCSALISGAEVAFFAISESEREDIRKNTPIDNGLLKLLDRPRYLLATILITNNFINVAIVVFSAFIFDALLNPETIGEILKFIIEVGLVTFFLVLFGEVTPKIYANNNKLSLANFMTRPLILLRTLFKPLSAFLVMSTQLIERRLAAKSGNNEFVSLREIDQAIELTVKNQKHATQEMRLLKGIVKFGNVATHQIMRSRLDVLAIDYDTPFEDLMNTVRESGFSRVPIYKENFDEIVGILYVKDLLKYLNKKDVKWQELIREAFFVPDTKKIDDLLKEMQERRTHMAIVVDEYGGTSGLVTLEDILEEIIGEIKDEFDDEIEFEYTKVDNFTYLFDGRILLNDVCRLTKIDTHTFNDVKGESDSLAGVMLEKLGRIPVLLEQVKVKNFQLTAKSVTKRRVKQIELKILPVVEN